MHCGGKTHIIPVSNSNVLVNVSQFTPCVSASVTERWDCLRKIRFTGFGLALMLSMMDFSNDCS